ncbi:Sialidase [Podospora didyma]|uniref:Sialidase n=1 Tax=Podospora didyma TaxID=330526 RepID=A0AAE0K9Z4_9PEZI|nr:Sialidase [Podospora didyma]
MSLVGAPITFGREPGSDYPRAIVTRNGTLLATYLWNDGTTTKIVTKKSPDQGATWMGPVEVISWDAKLAQLKNPFLFQTSSGTLLCSYLIREIRSDGKPRHMTFNVDQSTDGGDNGIQGEWEPFLCEDPDGTLQAYYSHELSPNDQDIVLRMSNDGGKTWGAFINILGAGVPDVRPGMPQVLSLDGKGNLLMVYESNAGKLFRVWAQTSTDGGISWGNPHVIFDPRYRGLPEQDGPAELATGPNAGVPGLARVSGLLVVSFMTNQDQPNKDYVDVANLDMKIITSADGGATWSPPVKVLSKAGWGGVTAVEGASHTVTRRHTLGLLSEAMERERHYVKYRLGDNNSDLGEDSDGSDQICVQEIRRASQQQYRYY